MDVTGQTEVTVDQISTTEDQIEVTEEQTKVITDGVEIEGDDAEQILEETDEAFDPNDMFDEDEGLYNVGAYDLSKYKDKLDVENPALATYIEGFEDKGFTQDQIEFIIDKQLSDGGETEHKKPTLTEIKETLGKSLNPEEKRNYSSVNTFVSNMLQGTEFEGESVSLLQDPVAVKMLNIFYKNSLGKTGKINSRTPKKTEKRISSMSFDDAHGQILAGLQNKTLDDKMISSLKARVNDKGALEQLLKAIGRG